ncbi:MAG: hypothetical protein HYV07_19830, partial [Deltaproteobacteria bacterium]|nr:hypothetical protein [Deltaproteobacteria bacterium]
LLRSCLGIERVPLGGGGDLLWVVESSRATQERLGRTDRRVARDPPADAENLVLFSIDWTGFSRDDLPVHAALPRDPRARRQLGELFRTGTVVDTCGGPCVVTP